MDENKEFSELSVEAEPNGGKEKADNIKVARSVNLQTLLKENIENFSEQLGKYSTLCENIFSFREDPATILEPLDRLLSTLNYDCAGLYITDISKKDRFLEFSGIGFNNDPGKEVSVQLSGCIIPDIPSIDWEKLMETVSKEDSEFSRWAASEQFTRIGFAPVFDGKCIYGIILTGMYTEKEPSPLATLLLELFGGRLGMPISAYLREQKVKRKDKWRETVLESAGELRDSLSKIHNLFESISGETDTDTLNEILKQCDKESRTGLALTDEIIAEASRGNV